MPEPEIDRKYRPAKFSKRHHYLPVFYLRGFVNEQGTFHVYDKITGKVLEDQKPDSKYFEKHLNNYKFDGEIKFTMEESYFTPQDSRAAPLFVRMREPGFKDEHLTALERFEVLGFLMSLYWRLPGTNSKALELIKKEGISNKYIGMFNGGQQLRDSDVPDLREKFFKDEQALRLYKASIPLTNGAMEEIYKLFSQWHLYIMNDAADPLVIGDDPFVFWNDNFSLDQLFGELIFPLGGNRLLVLSPNAPSYLDSTLTSMTNLAVLHQARRYISCQSKEYLLNLVAMYEKTKALEQTDDILKAAFQILHAQAKFVNYNDYLADFDRRFPKNY